MHDEQHGATGRRDARYESSRPSLYRDASEHEAATAGRLSTDHVGRVRLAGPWLRRAPEIERVAAPSYRRFRYGRGRGDDHVLRRNRAGPADRQRLLQWPNA